MVDVANTNTDSSNVSVEPSVVSTYFDEKGGFTDAFRTNASTIAGKETKVFDTVSDFDTLIKNHVELQGVVGGKMDEYGQTHLPEYATANGLVKVPNAESTPEQVAAFNTSRGVPVSADKYDFTSAVIPGGRELDKEMISAFTPIMHEAGVTQEGAIKLANHMMAYQVTQADSQAAAVETKANTAFEHESVDLKAMWPEDAMQSNCKAALKVYKEFLGETVLKDIKDVGLFEDPTNLALWRKVNVNPSDLPVWAKIAEKVLPGDFIVDDGQGAGGATPEAKQQKVATERYNHKTSASLHRKRG